MSACGNEVALRLLAETKCAELIKDHPVIEIEASTSIAKACSTLVRHGISSAPVFNAETQSYVGMLDYRDIVDYVLVVFKKKQLSPIQEDEEWSISEIIEKAATGEKVPAKAVVDLSHKNPFYSAEMSSSLLEIARIFGQSFGVHRVNIVDDTGRVKGIVSQSDIGRFLLSKRAEIGPIFDLKLSETGLGRTQVVRVLTTSTVLEALEKMSEFSVSSIAIVEPNGQLFGNISMADIRFIFQNNHYDRLWMHCSSFVSMTLSQKGLENDGKDRFPVFCSSITTPLKFALEKILVTRTHRLWITDEQDKLEGVVSLTDILRVFTTGAQDDE